MEQIDLSRLKTCASSAEVGYPGLAQLYLEKTGDSAGTTCHLCDAVQVLWTSAVAPS